MTETIWRGGEKSATLEAECPRLSTFSARSPQQPDAKQNQWTNARVDSRPPQSPASLLVDDTAWKDRMTCTPLIAGTPRGPPPQFAFSSHQWAGCANPFSQFILGTAMGCGSDSPSLGMRPYTAHHIKRLRSPSGLFLSHHDWLHPGLWSGNLFSRYCSPGISAFPPPVIKLISFALLPQLVRQATSPRRRGQLCKTVPMRFNLLLIAAPVVLVSGRP